MNESQLNEAEQTKDYRSFNPVLAVGGAVLIAFVFSAAGYFLFDRPNKDYSGDKPLVDNLSKASVQLKEPQFDTSTANNALRAWIKNSTF